MKMNDDKYYRVYIYPLKHRPNDVKAYTFLDKLGRNKTTFIVDLITGFLNNAEVTDVDVLTQDEALEIAADVKNAFLDINPNTLTNFLYELLQNSKPSENIKPLVTKKKMIQSIETSKNEDTKEEDYYNTDTTSTYDIMDNVDSIMSSFDS